MFLASTDPANNTSKVRTSRQQSFKTAHATENHSMLIKLYTLKILINELKRSPNLLY